MKNASNFLAANPNKAVQSIRQEIAQIIRTLRSTNDISKMELLKKQLERIKKLGGFEKIVPVEGIVFTYGGNTYKLTGAFAPINQILGTLKYSR
jgi:CRISPR/Cas system-associated protein Cas5 (RAMP superfamily)